MIVAIDGYSSCGKSTLSKALAKKLEFVYIDTGAMYRAVTLYFLNNNVTIDNDIEVGQALTKIDIEFMNIKGENTCFLNGDNVEEEIRGMRVSSYVSEVAAIPAVRDRNVELQRLMSVDKDVVMDGRDIGTVVFPDADLKIFVTADPKIRAQRRFDELISKGKTVSMEEVVKNLKHRDTIDTTRTHSPLRQAEDAFVIDNTLLTKEEQIDVAIAYLNHIENS